MVCSREGRSQCWGKTKRHLKNAFERNALCVTTVLAAWMQRPCDLLRQISEACGQYQMFTNRWAFLQHVSCFEWLAPVDDDFQGGPCL